MKYTEIPYKQIARYMCLESSDAEIRQLEDWLTQSEDNRVIFKNLLLEWGKIYDAEEEIVYPSKKKTWRKIIKGISKADSVYTQNRNISFKSVAIIFFIAFLIGSVLTLGIQNRLNESFMDNSVTKVETKNGQKTHLTLPDGSKIWLNAGSQINYSANYYKNERYLMLQGEAYIKVAKKNSRFIVNVGDVLVEATGTTFDLCAYEDNPNIQLALFNGEVSLLDSSTETLANMTSNQLAIISRDDLEYTIDNVDTEMYKAWTKGKLVFQNNTIEQVVKVLERWYDVEINLQGKTDRLYTFSTKDESLQDVLDLLNKMTPIRYSIKRKSVRLSIN